jgi:microcystin-dependent protein
MTLSRRDFVWLMGAAAMASSAARTVVGGPRSTPYAWGASIGEVRMGGWSFAPSGWALCDGSLLEIAKYRNLYQKIGKRFGGDGVKTFALPDFRGRMPVGASDDIALGTKGVDTELAQPYLCVTFVICVDGNPSPPRAEDSGMGEIRMFAYDASNADWATCDGRELQIKDNPKLFSVIADSYGGDGTKTFALPDMQDQIPMHPDPNAESRIVRTPGRERYMTASFTGKNEPAAAELPFQAVSFCISVKGQVMRTD